MNRGEFFLTKSVYAIWAWVFPVCYLFKCCLEPVGLYVHLRAFFEHSQLCVSMLFILSAFVYDLSVHIFCTKSFCLSRIRLLIWFRPFSRLLLVEYFSLLWNILFVYIFWSCFDIFLVFLLSQVFFG